jgi:uncharacterized protein involved in exopolysaccharide biosynthesis
MGLSLERGRIAEFLAPWRQEVQDLIAGHSGSSPDGGLTIIEVFGLVGRRWRTVAMMAMLGVIVALIYVMITPPQYSASVLVGSTNAQNSASGGASGALANLMRFSGQGAGKDSRFESFLLLLSSRQVAEKLDRDNHLLIRLNPSRWNPETHAWNRPSGAIFEAKESLKKALRLAPWSTPDASDIVNLLNSSVTLEETKVSYIYRITVKYEDTKFAVMLLQNIIADANDIMRRNEEVKATSAEAYLLQKLAASSTTSVDQRQALVELLVQQEQQLLVSNLRKNFAAEPLDSIIVSNGPIWPQTKLLLLVGLLLGAVVGAIIVFVRG